MKQMSGSVRRLFACALLLVGASSTALAAETASATLSDLRIQVISLGPGGGTASFPTGWAAYYSYNGTAYNNDSVFGPMGSPLAVSYQPSPTFSGSAATTAGDAFSVTGGPSAHATATAEAPNTYMQSYAVLMSGQMIIGPMTQLVFTATPTTYISASSPYANDAASVSIVVSDPTTGDPVAWDLSAIYTDFGGEVYDLRKPTLSLVFDNYSSVSLTRYVSVWTFASIVMSPVPEPSTPALALLGFGALGLWIRKRVQRGH